MPKNRPENQVTQAIDPQKLEDIFTRGISEIIPKTLFEQKLQNNEHMRIYLGVDPTGPYIHLGHAVILRKLRQLQELGHEIIFLIGDFTARIGDPTDRGAARVTLTHTEILENAKTYKEQASKILDFSKDAQNPARIEFNSTWLDTLRFQDVIELSARFTVQRMLERDMFEKRIKEEKPIYIHEFLYPVMQGYDSVALDVDAEVGGNDQLFNMLAGRTLQQEINKKEKVVITFDLLPGLDGRKMSKSYNNYVAVNDAPVEMFGKIMSLKDELIPQYFWLCTNDTKQDIAGVKHALSHGENPRDLKVCLARKIVTLYHSPQAANDAEREFLEVFQRKGKPTEIPTYTRTSADKTIVDVLVHTKLTTSKTEARRLIEQGGVKVNDQKIEDGNTAVTTNDIIQVGKRKFVRMN
ncbi:MAG TPA: tyrosine--tRNA ligase [Patescibacteria group bacterium]|nr:tyrosine--tRNA ligase [Patescibacteria group bacterium]